MEIRLKTIPNKRVVLFPAQGIGDALLMLIVAERLHSQGYEAVTVHSKLPELRSWFPHLHFEAEWTLGSDEWVIVENDNSPRIALFKQELRSRLSIFYPTYKPSKHGPLAPWDWAFDPEKTMVENTALATASLLQLSEPLNHNGITPPPQLHHRLHSHRVLLHTTSRVPEKNWTQKKFEAVAKGLEKRGFEPVFVKELPTLSDLAAFVYESGFVIGNDSLIGHLASNLQIPTLTIADDYARLKLWRPGWLVGSLVTLPCWAPPWKIVKKNWQSWISSQRVLHCFDRLSRLF